MPSAASLASALRARGRPVLVALALLAPGARPAAAQGWPFMFTVTTGPPAADDRWIARYEGGYGDRAPDPFGFDGMDHRLGFQGRLGGGFTVRGQAGLGIAGGRTTRTTQEVELLKDLLAPTRRVGVAMGLGLRREWEGATVLLGRVAAGHAFRSSSLFGNLLFERPLDEGRDAVDLLTTLGWRRRFGAVHLGVEAVGEDLEGFWEEEEAEGGAKLFVGPSIHLAPAGRAWSASLCGGPILYATRSGRSSPAVRPLEASGNGFTMRFAVAYSF
jgi:hypothetical protein